MRGRTPGQSAQPACAPAKAPARDLVEVMRTAQQAALQTQGAFDVTCRPLVELWKTADEHGLLPTESELTGARDASNWELIELSDKAVIKRSPTVCVDLGGSAKGYAVDWATEVMRRADVLGGLVDVGGDVVCLG